MLNALCGNKVHLAGVGGSGMQGLAEMLLERGVQVTGSDMQPFPEVGQLTQRGATVYIQHAAEHVPADAQLLVRSAAIPDSNPEIQYAKQRGIRILNYAEYLGEWMTHNKGICIAGTHGKSTTSGMASWVLHEAGLDPSWVIGAGMPQLGGRCHAGSGSSMVVESCEFGRSFLNFRPHSAGILNIEADHLDYYRDLADLVSAFREFCGQVSPDGLIVAPAFCESAQQAVMGASARVETFGTDPGAFWRASGLVKQAGCYAFDVLRDEQFVLNTKLSIPGLHNVSNALVTVALAMEAGAHPDAIASALGTYQGVERRMMLLGKSNGITVVDDYAHHPTEIRVTIEAIRERFEPDRTWVVFQPHQYSRTRMMMDSFADSFSDADNVLVPDIYAARDSAEDRAAVGSADLVRQMTLRGVCAKHLAGLDEVTDYLANNVVSGDLVITMGAGDVWTVAHGLVERIKCTV